ncbi:unnamed protein product [Heterobilharzia americana]|nr:unnamed protein product [Heterobilharzia americana]
MNANKDEALKCIFIARKRLSAGERDAAKKFLLKALRLDPSVNIAGLEFLMRPRSRSSSAREGSQESQGAPDPNPQPDTDKQSAKEFSRTQIDSLRKVLAVRIIMKSLEFLRPRRMRKLRKPSKYKNRAPGAAEAFKKIKKASEVLMDPEKRQRYDQFGVEEEQVRSAQVPRHGDTFFQYDADVFTMFFNGGFPFSQVYRDHRHRRQRSRESERESNYFVYIQLVPLIILFGLSFFSNLFVKDPYFSLTKSNKYYIERHTGTHKVPYYVKKTFEQISRVIFFIWKIKEKDYKENLLFRARYYDDHASYERAMQMHMPNCERLSEIFAT